MKLADCELTHIPRAPIDVTRALGQHRDYEDALRYLNAYIISLAADDALPDASFVEDTAVVLDEIAIIARPGTASRLGEPKQVSDVLAKYRPLAHIDAPATLEGGDVLRIDRTLYVGLGRSRARTNQAGADALRQLTKHLGYDIRVVTFDGCLHLKTAVTYIGRGVVLLNLNWVDAQAFDALTSIFVAPDEPHAGNALRLADDEHDGDALLVPASAVATADRLHKWGFRVTVTDISEFEKAEAGVTCLSLLLR